MQWATSENFKLFAWHIQWAYIKIYHVYLSERTAQGGADSSPRADTHKASGSKKSYGFMEE